MAKEFSTNLNSTVSSGAQGYRDYENVPMQIEGDHSRIEFSKPTPNKVRHNASVEFSVWDLI